MSESKFSLLSTKVFEKLFQPIDDRSSLDQWKQDFFNIVNELGELKLSTSKSVNETATSSFDPIDWTPTTLLAHQVLDTSLNYLQTRRDQPVWRCIPSEVRSSIQSDPLPIIGQDLSKICADVVEKIFPYARGNTHPRFWGWVKGEGTVCGVLAEIFTAALNINAGGGSHSAVLIERKVIQWMRELFGYPSMEHGGILLSGTSMATAIALATARRKYFIDVRKTGIIDGPQLIIYASTQTHNCLMKALELLGFGSKNLHSIPVDENFSIDIEQLKEAIQSDREKGLFPFCVIGNAGTVNTGGFDNLLELSRIAHSENLWFHVDGAFGSLIILDPSRRSFVDGIDQSDSIAFDFHKWFHCPYDAGCVLIRNSDDLYSTFSVHQSYLEKIERGCAGDQPWFCDLGVDLSRSFRALKVWMTIKTYGLQRLGEKIAENCRQAQYLLSLLEQYPQFIRVHRPVQLNIVNFRFEPKHCSESDLDQLNSDLNTDIQLSGVAVASTTRISNRLFIRVCIVSHRCTNEDLDIFVQHLLQFYQTRTH